MLRESVRELAALEEFSQRHHAEDSSPQSTVIETPQQMLEGSSSWSAARRSAETRVRPAKILAQLLLIDSQLVQLSGRVCDEAAQEETLLTLHALSQIAQEALRCQAQRTEPHQLEQQTATVAVLSDVTSWKLQARKASSNDCYGVPESLAALTKEIETLIAMLQHQMQQ